MLATLHDGLGARELHVGITASDHIEIRTAHQQESQLGLSKLFVEFGVAASRNIDLEYVLRLFDHIIVEGFFSRECRERSASRAGGGKSLDLAAFDETDPMGVGLDISGYKARMSK